MSNTFSVKQKFTNEVIEELSFQTIDDVENMLHTAYLLHKNDEFEKKDRLKVLKKISNLLEKDIEKFANLIANEGGKPIKDARVEVIRAIDGVECAISYLRQVGGREIPMQINDASSNKTAFTTLEPIGVVVSISAFNHPLNLIIHQVIPALATGCPVIVKPSFLTPLCAIEFAKLCKEAGVKDGWLQVALLDNDVASKLVSDKRVAFLSFIGSARVGWMLRKSLSNGARCALEHGGVAPLILDSCDDLNTFVDGAFKSAFYHSGQVCVSLQKLFIKKELVDDVVKIMLEKVKSLVVGDSANEDTDLGPIISKNEVNRIDSWVQEAIKEGADLLCGGEICHDICYKPTILLNPNKNSKVSNEEIFAPVICIYAYDNIDEVINEINNLDVAFQASIFSTDIKYAFNVSKRINASAVMVNDYTTFRVDWMPFAGRKSSGYGIGGINDSMNDLLEHKLMVIKH